MYRLTLLDAFPSWMTNGLFQSLGTWVPWYNDSSISKTALDLEYFGNRSGEKLLSPLLDKMVGTRYGYINITPGNLQRLNIIIQSLYADSWKRTWDALRLEYNPIENYDSTEDEYTGTDTTTKTSTDIKTGTGSDLKTSTKADYKTENAVDTSTKQKTDTKTERGQSTLTTNTLLPLGSPVMVAVDGSTTTGTAANNYDHTTGSAADNETTVSAAANKNYSHTSGAEADNFAHVTGSETDNFTHTEGAADDNFTHTYGDFEENHRRLTRRGNIGVTTSQQMIESEIDLRRKLYFDMVFADLDKILTINAWR